MGTKSQITRAAGIYGVGILVSRILGFLREMFIAYFLGTGMAADAFFVAFRLPNLWRRLFAEGTLAMVFVPIFTEYLQKSRSEALRLARATWTLLAAILILLSILGIVFAPVLVKLIAPGFTHIIKKFALTVNLTKIMFPYVFFICLTALTMAILNALGYFAAPAFSYALLNISMILSLIFAHIFHSSPVYCLALGVMVGGVLQLLLQLPFLKRENLSFKPLFSFHHPGISRIFTLMGPAVIGAAVYQLSIFINTLLASFLPEGSVSYLYYADRLVQFPLAMFAFSMGTAMLPTLSREAALKDIPKFKETLRFSLRSVFFVIFPASIGLIVLREPIIALIFERGAFSAASTHYTAQALLCYALGLIFFAGIRILITAFYSLQDTLTPVKIASFCLIFNVILGILLMIPLRHAGLALTTSIVALLNVILLSWQLVKKIGPFWDNAFWYALIKSSLAVIIMGVCIWLFNQYTNISYLKLVAIGLPLGVMVFFSSAYLLKCSELSSIRDHGKSGKPHIST